MIIFFVMACGDKGLTQYNSSPEISIQSHGNNTQVEPGSIVFRAQASDPNHSAEDLEVRWFVSENEACDWEAPDSSGESVCTIDLSEGTHTIIAEVQDPEQAGGRTEVTIQVESTAVVEDVPPPTLEIYSPQDGAVYIVGTPTPFQAIAFYDGSMDSLSFAWSSSIDGPLPITLDANGLATGDIMLTQGEHELTLLVVDPSGALNSDSRIVTVAPSNYPPSIDPIVLSPNPVYTSDILTSNIQVQDVEGDDITLSLSWSVDGVVVHTEEIVGSQASPSLDGHVFFEKNQQVSLSVTAADLEGESTSTAQMMVSNTLPSTPDISFVQQDGFTIIEASAGVDDIVCAVDTASLDADGDAITYTVSWEESGSPWTGSVSTTTHLGDTIPASETQIGHVFTCQMTPNDGQADGVAQTAQIGVVEVPVVVTIDTYNYNGMTYYPLHLDQCTPNIGMCCSPTTTQEQMDAFCQLAGYSTATNWVMQTLSSTNCYCWGGCTSYSWHSNCCSGQDNRNFITSVDCQ